MVSTLSPTFNLVVDNSNVSLQSVNVSVRGSIHVPFVYSI